MRQDIYKIIVERPRYWKQTDAVAVRRRDDFEGPTRLGMRAGYDYIALNENLAPLRRYLHAQRGRPWNKVFSEICAGIDGRNTVQQHILQHIDDLIAINVEVRADGELVDLGRRRSRFRVSRALNQELYVDPRTGLIRPNKDYWSWRRHEAENREREKAATAQRRRVLDDHTLLLLLDGQWYSVSVAKLPAIRRVYSQEQVHRYPIWSYEAELRYDILLRRKISRARHDDSQECLRLYGACLYATSKRQLSKREIKTHGLR